MRHLAIYESSTINAIFRLLRQQHKKCDISPFTTAAQEVRYLAVYESSTRDAMSRRLRDKSKNGYLDVYDKSTRNKFKTEESSDCIQTAKKLFRIIGIEAGRTPHKYYVLLLDKKK
jgi:hypothetical protein